MNHAPVSIIETRWWQQGNHSVKPIFEAVAALNFNNPSAFLYDMFSDRSSLKTIITQRCADKTTTVIYLATHGNAEATAIGQNIQEPISRTEFKNIVCSANKGKQVKGLFLGTCYTAQNGTIKFILQSGKTNLSWVAGYSEEVDWIEGSAIDMIFFNHLTNEYLKNKSRKQAKKTDAQIAKMAATETIKVIPAAHSKYGFNLYYFDGKSITSMFDGK